MNRPDGLLLRPGRLRSPPRKLRWLVSTGLLAVLLAGSGTAAPELAEAGGTNLQATAFAARSGPRGATLFTTLPPDRTGVHAPNRYADPAMWGIRYPEFAYGAIGTGVAIGDFDRDGLPDLFVVGKADPDHLFRNLGGWRFADVTARAGVAGPADAWKQGATFADVNNDGWLDLYICRLGAPNLLYLNQGDGTFVERARAAGLALSDASGMAAFCDYDRDGWLDVYIVTNVLDNAAQSRGQPDHLYHNRGDGTFTEVTEVAGITGAAQGHSAIWWDYNADGWPDLYVANDFGPLDRLYHNNGDGTFTDVLRQVVPHVPHFAMGSDMGDVDNDGRLDLYVADMLPTTPEKDLRTMIEMRTLITDPPTPATVPQYMRSALYLNTGAGRCLEAACLAGLAATDWTWSVRFEDLDNDGRVDLHVTNGMVRDFFDADLRSRIAAMAPADRLRAVKAAPVLREHNLAFRNLGGLRFANVSEAWGLDHPGVSFGTAFGDLDGDGDLDLAFSNFQGEPTLCRNDSDTGHTLIVKLQGVRSNRFGVGARVEVETAAERQVRELVLARGYLSSSEPVLHFGLGEEEHVRRLTVSWPSGSRQVFENLPADRRLTITEPAKAETAPPDPSTPAGNPTQFVEVGGAIGLAIAAREEAVDELRAQPLLPFRHNRLGPGVAVGDLDGDGQDDIACGGVSGDAPRILMNLGRGHYLPGGSSFSSRDRAVADAEPLILEANGDGRPDLLLSKGGVAAPAGSAAYQPQLYLGQGGGFFETAAADALPELPISAGPAVAADFDRDGRLDIFIGGRIVPGDYPTPPRSALLHNEGDGKFREVTAAVAPELTKVGLVTAALWTDIDLDGWPDLLLALEWGGIRCWRNRDGIAFEDCSEKLGFRAAGNGWWHSIAAADFNRDGRQDYAVGNLGLNTKYHASPEHPALLLRGVFDDSGRTHLLEAQFAHGRWRPMRGRSSLGTVMRELLRRFPTFSAFAEAGLEEIFSPERIQQARRFTASEFRSGVFLSQADGTFRFSPFPQVAQIAPVFGIAAGDFDGDGNADIYAVQNSYAPIPETGRFDGGLSQLLRGDGKGGFSAEPLAETGLMVPGDAKGLAVLDIDADGWPDFLVTRNGEHSLVFHNQGFPGRHSFGVRLAGSAENPTAIGARVTVELADGTKQTAEIHAGSGYLSQSSATCFFGFIDGNEPRQIHVQWPSGGTTTYRWTPGENVLRLSIPSGE